MVHFSLRLNNSLHQRFYIITHIHCLVIHSFISAISNQRFPANCVPYNFIRIHIWRSISESYKPASVTSTEAVDASQILRMESTILNSSIYFTFNIWKVSELARCGRWSVRQLLKLPHFTWSNLWDLEIGLHSLPYSQH